MKANNLQDTKECDEVTGVWAFQNIIGSGDEERKNKLFRCIYKLYHGDFINRITASHTGSNTGRDELRELAKEAFQEGIYAFCKYTDTNKLEHGAVLRTIIYTFCNNQFRWLKSRKIREQSKTWSYDDLASAADDENKSAVTPMDTTPEYKTYWDPVRRMLLSEEEYNLYLGISLLPKLKWQHVIEWRYLDQLTVAEIAGNLNVSKEDVSNTLWLAKKALEEILIKIRNHSN